MPVIRETLAGRARSWSLAIAALALLGSAGAAAAQAVPTIRWAGKDTVAGRVVGPPDLAAVPVSPEFGVTAADFRCGTSYANLAELLGVGADVLAQADVIAFELNGGSPGENGGWESADWLFRDGVHSFHVVWDAVANRSDPVGSVLANGSLSAARYRAYFGIAGTTHDEVISFQLLRVPPQINRESGRFRIRVAGFASGEGTPDPDAIGVFARACIR